ncbi:MAG: PadR family transcriptional regulator [Chloroflexota bacterium]|nr:PadR family transcriptional regulator [Chloroflexota bacterium]
MAVENALLGLLRREPRHGYELAREFAPDTPLGEVVHLEMSMLYALLKKLERDGLVHSAMQIQGSRPPRKVFELTGAGHEALDRWLAEPVERTRDLRLEFLLKLYIARDAGPELARNLIAGQYDTCARHVASLQEQIDAEKDSFRRLVLEMRMAQNAALLDWLAKARGEAVSA